MYMYSFSLCRVSVFSRRSWNVLCRGNHLSAGFADVLRQYFEFKLDQAELRYSPLSPPFTGETLDCPKKLFVKTLFLNTYTVSGQSISVKQEKLECPYRTIVFLPSIRKVHIEYFLLYTKFDLRYSSLFGSFGKRWYNIGQNSRTHQD